MKPTDLETDAARETAEHGAPHGITLFDHAQISAAIAEGDRPLAEILTPRGLNEAQWNESCAYWMTRMGDDVREHGKDARIPRVYSDAFSRAQDSVKPAPPMDAAAYAKLVVDIQRAGGPAEPLSARGLSTADYLRLSRHWARVLSTDPAQQKTFFETYQALQPAAPQESGS